MMVHWIWLSQLPYIGCVTAKRLIGKIGDAESVYHTDPEILAQKIKLTAKQLQSIKENRKRRKHYSRIQQKAWERD